MFNSIIGNVPHNTSNIIRISVSLGLVAVVLAACLRLAAVAYLVWMSDYRGWCMALQSATPNVLGLWAKDASAIIHGCSLLTSSSC